MSAQTHTGTKSVDFDLPQPPCLNRSVQNVFRGNVVGSKVSAQSRASSQADGFKNKKKSAAYRFSSNKIINKFRFVRFEAATVADLRNASRFRNFRLSESLFFRLTFSLLVVVIDKLFLSAFISILVLVLSRPPYLL